MDIGKKQLLLGFMITCLLASPLGIATAAGADWNSFHENAQHTGFTDQAADFTPTAWYFSTQGAIKSSPAIQNKIIYFGSNDGHVYAVNMEDGTKIWDYKTDGAVISSPSVVGDVLYVGSSDGYLYAQDIKNGNVKWKYKTGNAIESSPLVQDNLVYIGSNDGRVYAININNGTKVWEYNTGNSVRSSPVISGENLL